MSSKNEAGCLICVRNPCQCGGLEVEMREGVTFDLCALLDRISLRLDASEAIDAYDAKYNASRKVGR